MVDVCMCGRTPLRSPLGRPRKRCEGDPMPHLLPAADEDDDFEDIFLEDLPIRTLFPESWLWRKLTLPKSDSG